MCVRAVRARARVYVRLRLSDQSSFLPDDLKSQLPSITYMRSGAPRNISRLHGYDRTTYNGAYFVTMWH